MKKKFGLVSLILLIIILISTVQAAKIDGVSHIKWMGESGARLSNYYETDEISPLCTKIVLDTSPIGGIIKKPLMPILPPSGCTVSGWDTQQLTISCPFGLPSDSPVDLTDVLMEDADGNPMTDFLWTKIYLTFGSSCNTEGIFGNDLDQYSAFYEGYCGESCSVLKSTSSCYGASLEWTAWDDAVGYWLCWNSENLNCDINGKIFGIGGPLPPGTYNVHVVPVDSEGDQLCNSNTETFTIPEVCPNPIPEFPSVFLPAAMIIGFLGAVLLIQRTREQ